MDPMRVISNPVPTEAVYVPPSMAQHVEHEDPSAGILQHHHASSRHHGGDAPAQSAAPMTVVPMDMGVIGETPTQRYHASIQVLIYSNII